MALKGVTASSSKRASTAGCSMISAAMREPGMGEVWEAAEAAGVAVMIPVCLVMDG
jgi:hypothetical protein